MTGVHPTYLLHLSAGFAAYTALWVTAGGLAAGLCIRRRAEFSFLARAHWRLQLAPWKVATFAIALVGMVWLGPRSGDPTWDAVDASFMSVLTYLSAPWSVGTLARSLRRRANSRQAFVAAWLWLFSASWSYDLYILLRDGIYTPAWLANMGASSVLYMLAGLLWNLEWIRGQGTTLGFLREPWPDPSARRSSSRALLAALPLILIVAALMLGFFLHAL
jgi:hypothetical protein